MQHFYCYQYERKWLGENNMNLNNNFYDRKLIVKFLRTMKRVFSLDFMAIFTRHLKFLRKFKVIGGPSSVEIRLNHSLYIFLLFHNLTTPDASTIRQFMMNIRFQLTQCKNIPLNSYDKVVLFDENKIDSELRFWFDINSVTTIHKWIEMCH